MQNKTMVIMYFDDMKMYMITSIKNVKQQRLKYIFPGKESFLLFFFWSFKYCSQDVIRRCFVCPIIQDMFTLYSLVCPCNEVKYLYIKYKSTKYFMSNNMLVACITHFLLPLPLSHTIIPQNKNKKLKTEPAFSLKALQQYKVFVFICLAYTANNCCKAFRENLT